MTGWRLACGRRARLGESPVWDERRGELVCLDIDAAEAWRVRPGRGVEVHGFARRPCSLGLCTSGRWLIAFEDSIAVYDPERRAVARHLAAPPLPPQVRFNDGKVGPDGAFYVGTMSEASPRRRDGALFRIDAAGGVTRLREGVFNSNGLAWSPDGGLLYHSDSRGPWIERRVSPDGAPRTVAAPDEAAGRPDGAACDADGRYWSAGVSAGVINVFSPEGELLARHPTPMDAPTMPCFGGPDFATLFVTSLSDGLDPGCRRGDWDGAVIMAQGLGRGFPGWRFTDPACDASS